MRRGSYVSNKSHDKLYPCGHYDVERAIFVPSRFSNFMKDWMRDEPEVASLLPLMLHVEALNVVLSMLLIRSRSATSIIGC